MPVVKPLARRLRSNLNALIKEGAKALIVAPTGLSAHSASEGCKDIEVALSGTLARIARGGPFEAHLLVETAAMQGREHSNDSAENFRLMERWCREELGVEIERGPSENVRVRLTDDMIYAARALYRDLAHPELPPPALVESRRLPADVSESRTAGHPMLQIHNLRTAALGAKGMDAAREALATLQAARAEGGSAETMRLLDGAFSFGCRFIENPADPDRGLFGTALSGERALAADLRLSTEGRFAKESVSPGPGTDTDETVALQIAVALKKSGLLERLVLIADRPGATASIQGWLEACGVAFETRVPGAGEKGLFLVEAKDLENGPTLPALAGTTAAVAMTASATGLARVTPPGSRVVFMGGPEDTNASYTRRKQVAAGEDPNPEYTILKAAAEKGEVWTVTKDEVSRSAVPLELYQRVQVSVSNEDRMTEEHTAAYVSSVSVPPAYFNRMKEAATALFSVDPSSKELADELRQEIGKAGFAKREPLLNRVVDFVARHGDLADQARPASERILARSSVKERYADVSDFLAGFEPHFADRAAGRAYLERIAGLSDAQKALVAALHQGALDGWTEFKFGAGPEEAPASVEGFARLFGRAKETAYDPATVLDAVFPTPLVAREVQTLDQDRLKEAQYRQIFMRLWSQRALS
jgi:hypothetical protein